MASDDKEPDETLRRAMQGEQSALADMFQLYRGRLSRMIALRMDPRVQGRIDVSDVLQEAFIDAAKGLPNYVSEPALPFYLWLRLLTGQRLAKAHRTHLGTARRQIQREVSIAPPVMPDLSTFNLASHLIGKFTSASGNLMRDELRARVQKVLDDMERNDREVLALRHFEEMTNREVASVLEISEAAAKSRYRRALLRITEEFEQSPELLD